MARHHHHYGRAAVRPALSALQKAKDGPSAILAMPQPPPKTGVLRHGHDRRSGLIPSRTELWGKGSRSATGRAGVLRAAGAAIPVDQSDAPDLQCLGSPHHELVEPRLGGPNDFCVHRLDQPVDR